MSRLFYHFRGHILSTATEAVSDLSGVETNFWESKVSDFDMSIVVDKEIFGFKISIDDVLLMKVHESVKDLDKVESSIFLAHSFDGFEVVE